MLIVLALLILAVNVFRYVRSWIPVTGFERKAVFITGCDSGFGRLACERIARRGFKVFAGCLTEVGMDDIRKLALPNLTPISLDVTKQDSVDKALETLKKDLPEDGLHAVLNNAGILVLSPTEMADVEDLSKVLAVNTVGLARVTRACLPLLRQSKGRVINTASVAGRLGFPGIPYYTSSKYAVEGLSDALRREMLPWNVPVVLVEPGVMKTPLYEGMMSPEATERRWNNLPAEIQEAYGREFLMKGTSDVVTLMEALAGNPNQVAAVYERAVVSRYPMHRYPVGMDAWLVFVPLSLLPSWAADWIWAVLDRSPVPAALQGGSSSHAKKQE